jgi:hypothetical protein
MRQRAVGAVGQDKAVGAQSAVGVAAVDQEPESAAVWQRNKLGLMRPHQRGVANARHGHSPLSVTIPSDRRTPGRTRSGLEVEPSAIMMNPGS